MSVIVRFAPSPTGYLHIGGARTAIFNYLYARHHKGKFYLRIEDTDIERSEKQYEDEILESMQWLGMDYDGDPVYQSKRTDLYKSYIKKLLESGHAYFCNCSKEELDAERERAMAEKRKAVYSKKCRNNPVNEGVIRFKIPESGATKFVDTILGEISINHEEIEDFVIARADGSPTYNFTVVVDDADMGITTVIRGDDHVNNTPKQILIYQALGLMPPTFAHVPMILGSDKKKLSKRHGATAVTQYRKAGYLPEALFNYLVRLGWSHGDQEIFTKEELVKAFDTGSIGSSAAVLNVEKLNWLNAHYIKSMDPKDMTERLISEGLVPDEFKNRIKDADVQRLLPMVQERSKFLGDAYKGLEFFLKDKIEYDPKAYEKYITPEIKPVLSELKGELEKLSSLDDLKAVEAIFTALIEKHNINLKNIAQATRVLITGTDISPGIFEIITMMDKKKVLERLSV
ncbi:MAG: glutamate--tRNA ligase [bacterium]